MAGLRAPISAERVRDEILSVIELVWCSGAAAVGSEVVEAAVGLFVLRLAPALGGRDEAEVEGFCGVHDIESYRFEW